MFVILAIGFTLLTDTMLKYVEMNTAFILNLIALSSFSVIVHIAGDNNNRIQHDYHVFVNYTIIFMMRESLFLILSLFMVLIGYFVACANQIYANKITIMNLLKAIVDCCL